MENQFMLNSLIYKQKGNKAEAIPYQDRMDARSFADGISIVVLADGLGSKQKSEVGAEIAVQTALVTLHKLFHNFDGKNLQPEEVKKQLLSQIRNKIEIKAKQENIADIKEYACTLLFAVMTPNHLAVGQLGDGYIVLKKNGQSIPQLAFSPKDEKTEYANATRTIFDSPQYMQLALGEKQKFDSIFLSSDGTDKLRGANFRGQYTPFVTAQSLGRKPQVPIFAFMEKLLEDSSKAEIRYADYPEKLTNQIIDMLLKNPPDDDVTFALLNPNQKGPTRRVRDLLEILDRGLRKGLER